MDRDTQVSTVGVLALFVFIAVGMWAWSYRPAPSTEGVVVEVVGVVTDRYGYDGTEVIVDVGGERVAGTIDHPVVGDVVPVWGSSGSYALSTSRGLVMTLLAWTALVIGMFTGVALMAGINEERQASGRRRPAWQHA